MRDQPTARFGAMFFALALSACAGTQGGNALPVSGISPLVAVPLAAMPSAVRDPKGATTLAVTLPPIQPKNVAIDWSSKPNVLSSATQSVSGTVGNTPFGPIKLSSSRASCQASTAGRVCTVTLDAKAGTNVAIDIATYGKKTAAADKLAIGSVTQSIFKGQVNVAKPSMTGVIRGYGIQAEHPTVTQGFATGDLLAIYGVDAAGSAIPSSVLVSADGKYLTKFNLKYSGPTVQASHLHRCCGIVAAFIYDGVLDGTETMTATAKGDGKIVGSGTVTITPGSTVTARLLTQGTAPITGATGYLNFVAEFPLSASGNVAPARTFIPATGGSNFFGEDAKGNFWTGNTHVTNRGTVLGTVNLSIFEQAVAADFKGRLYVYGSSGGCTIVEYPAGKYGTVKPVRQINVSACAEFPSVTVDRTGNVFVPVPSGVVEFPPSGSGSLTPVRTIALPAASNPATHLDVDGSGNLYVATAGQSHTGTVQLLEFAPGATTGTQLLSSVALETFAVDDAGDIYACVAVPGVLCSVEYFTAGSSTPSRTISGSNTMIYGVPIVVPRT